MRPAPTLAQSPAAQAEFRRIQTQWLALPPGERDSLEVPLQAFLDQYATDDLARIARVYLAFILIRAGRLDEARGLVEPVRQGPQGSARDFALVADGGILIREGRPEEALRLLQPLRGKLVDPAERLLFGEQLVHAALESDRWSQAVAAMVEWIAEAEPEHQAGVQATVELLVRRIPQPELERLLAGLDADAASRREASSRAPARDWIRGTVRRHLGEVALERHDAALAKRLVASAPVTLLHDDTGLALLALAGSGRVEPRVAGRSVGLVLSVHSRAARRRSAAVAAGMSRALGLPAASRRADAVRLLMRDAGDEEDAIEQALAGLAGDGAAMLVVGVDAASGSAAQRFAERLRIPVLLLYPPRERPVDDGFTFVLGESGERVQAVLTRALADQGVTGPVRVGAGGVDCNATTVAAGTPRFPVAAWREEAVEGLVVLGDPACAQEVANTASAVRFRPWFALGLEAAPAAPRLATQVPTVVVAAGRYPAPPTVMAELGTSGLTARWPDWYEVLGQDAGTLASSVLLHFPLERVEDVVTVTRLHRRARDELASVRVQLDTTTATGFSGGRTIERELEPIVSGPSRTGARR